MAAAEPARPLQAAPAPRRGRARALRGAPLVFASILAVVVLAALLADVLATYPPDVTSLRARLKPPAWVTGGTWDHPLGTDALGRDVYSRMLYGARVSLSVGLLAVVFSGAIGVTLGLVAGYYGGRLEAIIMRLTDAVSSIPVVLVALLFVVTLGASLFNVVIALSVLLWSRYTRVVRSDVLSLRERDFVTMARIADAPDRWILTRHILPNVLSTVMVMATLQVGVAILTEATLSFLGAGVPPPTPAWGSMVADGRDYITTAWWISFVPGVAIFVTVLAANLLGDWLRDQLDPKFERN